jgi:hypothetical protein
MAALGSSDDSCGVCPETTFVCPASGTFSVLTAPFGSTSSALCEPVVSAVPAGSVDGKVSADAGVK